MTNLFILLWFFVAQDYFLSIIDPLISSGFTVELCCNQPVYLNCGLLGWFLHGAGAWCWGDFRADSSTLNTFFNTFILVRRIFEKDLQVWILRCLIETFEKILNGLLTLFQKTWMIHHCTNYLRQISIDNIFWLLQGIII